MGKYFPLYRFLIKANKSSFNQDSISKWVRVYSKSNSLNFFPSFQIKETNSRIRCRATNKQTNKKCFLQFFPSSLTQSRRKHADVHGSDGSLSSRSPTEGALAVVIYLSSVRPTHSRRKWRQRSRELQSQSRAERKRSQPSPAENYTSV